MKKWIVITLIVMFSLTGLVGCGDGNGGGGGTDLSSIERRISDLETQNAQQADKISGLETQNQQQADKIEELQVEVDRANYKYDWDNPIDIDLTAFVNLYNTNKDEFINTYFNRVARFSGVANEFSYNNQSIPGSYSTDIDGKLMVVFYKPGGYDASLTGIQKTYLAIYDRVGSNLYLYDCRVAK